MVMTLLRLFCFCFFFASSIEVVAEGPDDALKAALFASDPEGVTSSIEAGADPNRKDIMYPLIYAITSGDLDLTEALLKGGANPNLASDDLMSPVMSAVLVKNYDLLKLLLQYGGDPNTIQSVMSSSAFTSAVNSQDVRALRLMLEAGFTPDFEHEDMARNKIIGSAIQSHNPQIMALILPSAPPEAINRKGLIGYPIEEAINAGPKVLEAFLSNATGIDTSVKTTFGGLASVALMSGDLEVMRLLIAGLPGFDVNERDMTGFTPLMTAISGDDMDMIRLLLSDPKILEAEFAAEVKGEAMFRGTILSVLIRSRNEEIIALILPSAPSDVINRKGQRYPIEEAMDGGPEVLKAFLDNAKGVDPSVKSVYGGGLAAAALVGGDVDIMRILIEGLPDLDLNERDGIDYTPLMSAASDGNVKMVRLLLSYPDRIQINATNGMGVTAYNLVDESSDESSKEIRTMLLQAGG